MAENRYSRFAHKKNTAAQADDDFTEQKVQKRNFKFFWKGTNADGYKTKGSVVTTSIMLAKAQLLQQGIKIASLKKESPVMAFLNKRRVKRRDITALTRQLATMVSAGIPIVQCFDVVTHSSDNAALNDVVVNIKSDVKSGVKLSQALGKYPKYFNQLYCALIAAGEESGALAIMLVRLANYLEKIESTKRKVKKALFYPATVVFVGLGVSSILLLKVIPEFKDLFSGFHTALPAYTQFVLNLSLWARQYIYLILGTIVTMSIGFGMLYRRSFAFRFILDTLVLKLPVLGKVFVKSILARFARTLATTFSAGMPLVDALTIVAKAPDNLLYEKAIENARRHVIEGKALYMSLEMERVFPNILLQMVAIGEESGALDEMLNKAAIVYEEEVDAAVDALSSLIEPVIMVILGILVGGLVIAMYLPIFQLSNVVSK